MWSNYRVKTVMLERMREVGMHFLGKITIVY